MPRNIEYDRFTTIETIIGYINNAIYYIITWIYLKFFHLSTLLFT